MATEIPKQTIKKEWRYIGTQPNSKGPIKGEEWQGDKPIVKTYTYNRKKLVEHLSKGGNYAILCGYGGLVVLDIDDKKYYEEISKMLPETLEVETGTEGKRHKYFMSDDVEKFVLYDREKHIGEYQGKGAYVIGPNSIHPITKRKYKIINDKPIAKLSREIIQQLKIKYDKKKQFEVNWGSHKVSNAGSQLSIDKLVDMSKFKRYKDGEYYGEHPTHGSTTGMNFFINTNKNLWYCFRDKCGGDSIHLLAMQEGLINCGENVEGNNFRKTLAIATNKYGVNFEDKVGSKPQDDYEITQEEIDDLEDLEVVNANDVEGLDIPSAEWIVDTMAPEGGLTIAAGKSASYKSITFLHMAHCIAVGVPVFNKYITKKPGPVIYLNEENTWSIFKPMVSMIQKGMRTYVKKDLDFKDLHFLTYQQVSLDVKNRRGRAKLEKAIQETGAKVIIFDSLKRFIDFEENDADNVNRFYSFVVKPLMIKYGVTIILLHHVRKDSHGNFKHKGDKKDLLRGSSDFVNIADSILYFERGITNLQFELYQIKNRLAEEFEPKLIRITADADAGFVFTIEEGEQEKNETGKCIDEIIGYIFREKLEEFKSGTKMEALFKDAGFKRGVYNFARNKIVDAKVLVKMDGKKGTYSVDWNHPALIEMLRQEEEKIQTKLGDVEDDSNK